MAIEKVREYTLQSKDVPLIDFSLYKKEQVINYTQNTTYRIHIDKIYEENAVLWPKSFSMEKKVTEQQLYRWIQKRKAPKNRQFVENILSSINDDQNPLRYADVTQALSVNDGYWITAKDFPQKWADCNLYDHPFNERLAMVAFTGYSVKVPGIITTPETTSSGALKKCWTRRKGDIYLMKGDDFMPRSDGRTQASLEWYAAQVAQIMKIPHVDYQLERYTHSDGIQETVSLCKLFTSAKEGYVDAYTYFSCKGLDMQELDDSDLENQVKMADIYGQKEYADMMVFDSLICNKDRHFANFGYLVDNDTGQFLRPAPIFDNGRSLLYDASSYDLAHLDEYMQGAGGQGASLRFDTQAKLFVENRHREGLRKLAAFSFKNHPTCSLPPKTLQYLTAFVRKRAQQVMALYKEKEQEKKRFQQKRHILSPKKDSSQSFER